MMCTDGSMMTRQELENCITEYGRDIYSFCRFITGNRQEADDLYQETFLRAVEHCGRMNIQENPKGYLLSMSMRLWKDKRRKLARRQRIAPEQTYLEGWEPSEETGESPETAALQKELQARVREAVDSLAEKYRITVLLYYMEEMNAAQIAQILKVPVGTIKSRLFQARKLLKQKLECIYDE